MNKKHLICSLIVALAQASVVGRGLAANVGPQNMANQSSRQTVEMQIESWIDRYVGDVGGQRSFSSRLRNHLARLMLQEDSISFLQNLVDRGALRRNTPIESHFEEYVHFITWQSIRRMPESYGLGYLQLLEGISQHASEDLCREYRRNKSTFAYAPSKRQFEAIANLPQSMQDFYFKAITIGFKRLVSGAYPQSRLTEAQIADLQASLRVTQQPHVQMAGACSQLRVLTNWVQSAPPGENLRLSLWQNGLLPD
jgi:hypothetical protein